MLKIFNMPRERPCIFSSQACHFITKWFLQKSIAGPDISTGDIFEDNRKRANGRKVKGGDYFVSVKMNKFLIARPIGTLVTIMTFFRLSEEKKARAFDPPGNKFFAALLGSCRYCPAGFRSRAGKFLFSRGFRPFRGRGVFSR